MRVVIVGGGAAGVLTAMALLPRFCGDDSITIVEPRERLGEGVAYSTRDPLHLLNVPALLMSAFEQAPTHFADYLAERGLGGPGSWARRSTYAEYLRHSLQTCVDRSAAGFKHIRATVLGVEYEPDRVVVRMPTEIAEADHVVLCIGHGTPRSVPGHPAGTVVPWTDSWQRLLEQPPKQAVVAGTGLTAVDVIASLAARGCENILAVSPSGEFPQPHLLVPKWPATGDLMEWVADAKSAGEIIRRTRLAAQEAGPDWRCVVDGLRPHVPTVLSRLPTNQRDSLARHALPVWERLRHRMPPQSATLIHSLSEAGQLTIRRGRLRMPRVGRIEIKHGAVTETLRSTGAVVVCTGRSRNPIDAGRGLGMALMLSGLAAPNTNGNGIRVKDGEVIGPASNQLSAIGLITTDSAWENFAISSIRRQAAQLANRLSPSSA